MSEEIFSKLCDAIIELDDQRSKDVVRQGIEEGLSPLDMINKGIRFALDVLGERFSAGDLFLPELVLAAKAADAAVEILEPELLKRGASENILGKVLIATVKDDIHDIGKNIVALLMKAAGFDVVDIGVNLSAEEILNIYKRGALRLNLTVRSCDDSSCTDDPWNETYTNSTFNSLSVSNNRYFQYRAYFETDTFSYSPELKSVVIGPTHYPGDNPTVQNNNWQTYDSLSSFTEVLGAGNE